MTTKCHAINLPKPGAYVAAWKRAKQAPAGTLFNVSWDRPSVPREEVLRDFQKALHNRINIRGGDHEACNPIPAEWIRDCRAVHDRINRRVRVYSFETPECRDRFAHLLSDRND